MFETCSKILQYYLMFKDNIVAILTFNEAKLVKAQYNMDNICFKPLGCYKEEHIKEWWKRRSVPKTRKGINKILAAFKLPDTENLVLNNLGLSLTDCYWVKPISSSIWLKCFQHGVFCSITDI